jgi:NADH:ubiquinone oxidoreductase subunit C
MFVQLYYLSFRRLKKNALFFSFKKMKLMLNYINLICFRYVSCIIMKSNNFFLILKDNNIINVFTILKYNFSLSFSQLMDLIIVDKLEMKLIKGKRFNFVYVLLSVFNNFRIFVSGFLSLFEVLPTLINLFKSAD